MKRILAGILLMQLWACSKQPANVNIVDVEVIIHKLERPVVVSENDITNEHSHNIRLRDISALWKQMTSQLPWDERLKLFVRGTSFRDKEKIAYVEYINNDIPDNKVSQFTVLKLIEIKAHGHRILYTLEAPYVSEDNNYPFRITNCYRYVDSKLLVDKPNQFNDFGKHIMFRKSDVLEDVKLLQSVAANSTWTFN